MSLKPCEYKTGKTLGKGSYATVKECIHTGNKFACKIINKQMMKGKEKLIRNEVDILQRISKGHPNVITMHDMFESKNNSGELFYEICNRGNFYEEDARKIVKTIVSAIEYLHVNDIVHRENLLYRTKGTNPEDLILADFGLSTIIDSNKFEVLTAMCGTPGYIAPEVLLQNGYSKPVDMWAVGVIAYLLLSGCPPFEGIGHEDEYAAILDANFSFKGAFWDKISTASKDFISSLLVKEPSKRLEASQAVKHSWMLRDSNISGSSCDLDLLPSIKPNLSEMRRKKLKRVVDVIRAARKFSEVRTSLGRLNNLWDSEENSVVAPVENDDGEVFD